MVIIRNTEDYKFLLNEYAKSSNILSCIQDALCVEELYRSGFDMTNNMCVKAEINPGTGLWETEIKVEHGLIRARTLNKEMTLIALKTIPGKKYFKNNSNFTDQEIDAYLETVLSEEVLIDLNRTSDLTKVKQQFADDYVLKNIHFVDDRGSERTAAEMIVWYLRTIRRKFYDYHKNYSFLWRSTECVSVTQLFNDMKAYSLI